MARIVAVVLLAVDGLAVPPEPAEAGLDLEEQSLPGGGGVCQEAEVEGAEDLAAQAMVVELLQRGFSHLRPIAHAGLEAAANTSAGSGACGTSVIGRMAHSLAPRCAAACPGLCTALEPFAARLQRDAAPTAELCNEALVTCVASFAAECRPVLAEAAALGLAVPRSADEIMATCRAVGLSGGGMAAATAPVHPDKLAAAPALAAKTAEELLRSRAAMAPPMGRAAATSVDASVVAKQDDPRCEHAPEGQTCVSRRTYVYCSNHKRLSAGETNCEQQMGARSRCVSDGIGLQIGRCDDPFCRNGGAWRGDGLYCHRNDVVSCSGDAEPRVQDSCSDQSHTRYIGGKSCEVTTHYKCQDGRVGFGWGPRCVFDYQSDDC